MSLINDRSYSKPRVTPNLRPATKPYHFSAPKPQVQPLLAPPPASHPHYLPRVTQALSKAHVPLVTGTRVILNKSPRYGNLSYYDFDHDTVYWMPDVQHHYRNLDLYHEFGHAFDHKILTDDNRTGLMKYFGGPKRDWWWGSRDPQARSTLPDPYEEAFAEAYSHAAFNKDRQVKLRKYLYKLMKAQQQ